MKFFLLAASVSKTSVNKKLIALTATFLRDMGQEVDHAQFEEFPLPLYDANMQEQEGIPQIAEKFVKRLHSADKVVFSSPEYNGSLPGTFKNLIDWVSRIQPMPWDEQDILLLSASPSIYGGMRGLMALKQPFHVCGAYIFPKVFCLSKANEAFDTQGKLNDPKKSESLKTLLSTFAHTKIVREK